LGSIFKSKLIFCNKAGQFLFYTSDRYGFNNDATAMTEKYLPYWSEIRTPRERLFIQAMNIAGNLRKSGRNTVTFAIGGN